MARRNRPEELSREELLSLARQEMTPYWINSGPVFGATLDETGAHFMGLDSSFEKKDFLLVLTDLSCPSSAQTILEAQEFHRRFAAHGVSTVVCLKASYAFYSARGFLEALAREKSWELPMCVDPENAIHRAFSAEALPKVVFFEKGKVHFVHSEPEWFRAIEPQIHHFLRARDPGLALPFLHKPFGPRLLDAGGLELGAEPSPGVEVSGKWKVVNDHRGTQDPQAFVKFRLPTPGLSIVAKSMDSALLPSDIVIELNGRPLRDSVAGRDIERDESGSSVFRPGGPRALRVIENAGEAGGEVTLRFTHSHRVGSYLFGARFFRWV